MPVGDAQPPADPLIGVVLSDRYRIVRKLGEGGMGAVYQAEHALIEKRLALKVLSPELAHRPELVARFLQEAKAASRIGHENVVDISDFGQSPEGLVYVAMEYLEGRDLGQLLRTEGALRWPRVRPILMQIAKALRAAHEHGIIHRDLKPGNVFLVHREGRPDHVKVLDFGVAASVDEGGDPPGRTQAGMIFGAAEYMAPEQAQGQPLDHRVDVYALGCLMYQLLTGSVPFAADNVMGVLSKHAHEPVEPPRWRNPRMAIAPDVEAVCLRALEKERDNRWQDMDQLYRAFGQAGGEPFEASGVYTPSPSVRFPNLAQATPAPVRKPRPEVTPPVEPAASPAGDPFDDERPVARETSGLRLGGAFIAVAVVAAIVFLAVRPTPKPEAAAEKPTTIKNPSGSP
jgi:serine/threonine-protein kinase